MVDEMALVLVAAFMVIVSGLFAGAETGMYRLSRLRLRLGIEKKKLSYIILGEAMDDSTGLLLSMLIGTNLTHYLVTSIVTYMLLRKVAGAYTAELSATLLTAPTLFVFAELIPKNIFFYRADSLMPYCAPVLLAFHKLFTWSGAVPLLKLLSRVFARLTHSAPASKTVTTGVWPRHIRAIFRDTQEEGVLSRVQAEIINRLVSISNIPIRSVMTPISKVEMVDVNSDRARLLDKLKRCPFTRLPVYEGEATNIVGFINIYEALGPAERLADLRSFVKPIRRLSADTIVTEAINIVQREHQRIVLVARVGHTGREKPVGIVTMKDLVEELLGELTEW